MRKIVFPFVLAFGIVGGGIYAQDVNPDITLHVTTVSIDDANVLAVTPDGEFLLATDDANNQAHVFMTEGLLSNNVDQVASADLYGAPTALAATNRYGLVAVATGDESDLIQVLDFESSAKDITYSLLDVTRNPNFAAFSPDNRWGIVTGSDGYTVWEWLSAENVNLYQMEDGDIRGAALSSEIVYLLHSGGIDTLRLNTSEPPIEGDLSANFDAAPVSINLGSDVGVVALENDDLILFNLETLDTIASINAGVGPITAMEFVALPDALWLAVTAQGQAAVFLFDVSDPNAIEPLGQIALDAPARALTTYDDMIFVSDGSSVMVIQASA